MIKFSQIKSFVTVVECGSINKAAEQLFITQPTLSRILKSLENEIGKQLLYRQNQGVVPTREGKLLYRYAQSILAELSIIDRLKNNNIDELFSELSISVYSLFLNKKIFTGFMNDCKSKEISLYVQEVSIEALLNNIYTGVSEVGIAVISDIEFAAVQQNAFARKLNMIVVDSESLYIHVGPKSPLYNKEEVCMEDMLESTYLHLPFDRYSREKENIVIDNKVMGQVKSSILVDNYSVIKHLLKETDCFCLGNSWQEEELKQINVETKKIKNNSIKNHLVIITNGKSEELSVEATRFIELVHTYYK